MSKIKINPEKDWITKEDLTNKGYAKSHVVLGLQCVFCGDRYRLSRNDTTHQGLCRECMTDKNNGRKLIEVIRQWEDMGDVFSVGERYSVTDPDQEKSEFYVLGMSRIAKAHCSVLA